MDADLLLKYARAVKNARLVLFSREKPRDEILRFLRQKHRYREMAVVKQEEWMGKAFREFHPPAEIDFPVRDDVLRKALNASLFLLSPLLLFQQERELEPLVAWRRRGRFPDLGDLLRHIRIAEYAMIDAVQERVDRDFAAKDGEKRFWRIKEEGDSPAVDYIIHQGRLCVVIYALL